ncbi:MAG: hypothetical protein U9O96_03995 [Candidatus Thermoplasmatota archaeon]|nr:hypothetical protein [Candidatus Thermoplasmatota archaeon]
MGLFRKEKGDWYSERSVQEKRVYAHKYFCAMKRLLIFAFIMISFILSGCILYSHTSSTKIVSITPDKTVYHSGDRMTLYITLKSSDIIKNVTVNATGLENRIGQILLHESKVTNLVKGINNVTFEYTLPSCSPCNKLDPGTYPIDVTISYDGKIIAQSTENIQLER